MYWDEVVKGRKWRATGLRFEVEKKFDGKVWWSVLFDLATRRRYRFKKQSEAKQKAGDIINKEAIA